MIHHHGSSVANYMPPNLSSSAWITRFVAFTRKWEKFKAY